MEELKDHPGPSHKPKKVLYLCFGEYYRSNWAYYSIHAFDLEKNCHILRLGGSSVVAETKKPLPVLMGCGVYRGSFVLAGGSKSEFDGYARFTPHPCRDVYTFDIGMIPKYPPHMARRHPSLQHGKIQPLVLEHNGNLYVLSHLTGHGEHEFEKYNLNFGKWVTLPESPLLHRRYLGHRTNRVVVGTNIFVSCLSSIFRFDMADTSETWKEHSFTDCIELPYDFNDKSLVVEMSDGNWLIFTCFPELHADEFDDRYRCCDCDEYECGYSSDVDYYLPPRHYIWQRTSLPAYLMSKDFTSLTPIQPLCLPDDLLPTQPGCELLPRFRDLYTAKPRDIDYRIVHLGGQEICLILSVNTGFESKGVLRKVPVFVVSFEFQLADSRDFLTIKTGSCSVQCFVIGAKHSSATKVSIYGAFWR